MYLLIVSISFPKTEFPSHRCGIRVFCSGPFVKGCLHHP